MENTWEENVYKKYKQINKYPNTTVVSSVFTARSILNETNLEQ